MSEPWQSIGALAVLATLAIFAVFAIWLLIDGIRLMWRGEPPEVLLPQSRRGQSAWRFFQGAIFIALVWIIYRLPVPEGGHNPDPLSTTLVAGAVSFFLTYIASKIGGLLRRRK